jgi:hypothetical protein
VLEDRVYLHSLIAAEHDAPGFAVDAEGLLTRVKLSESLNPCAEDFVPQKLSRLDKRRLYT